jgi:hypothetical protein
MMRTFRFEMEADGAQTSLLWSPVFGSAAKQAQHLIVL